MAQWHFLDNVLEGLPVILVIRYPSTLWAMLLQAKRSPGAAIICYATFSGLCPIKISQSPGGISL